MEYRDLYEGHIVNAWTTEVGDGRWTWSCTIDDEAVIRHSGDPAASERLMLDQAIDRARRAIDAYPKE